MNSFEIIKEIGIIPVIKIPEESFAEPLAKALIEGGLPLIEVTLRNECALSCIRRIKESYPDMCVGAGTVLSIESANAAKAAGADFAVAPGFDQEIVKHCQKIGFPFVPGCVTPTEISAGMNLGLDTLKFFPSEILGGVKIMKELSGPYNNINFIATSGIRMDNLKEYMACKSVAAVGGSFVAPSAMILKKDWAGITNLCKQAVDISLGFHLAHVGINNKNDNKNTLSAVQLSEIFNLPFKEGTHSDFVGSLIESCKTPFPGTNGHIAIGTLSVNRAAAYLARKRVAFREEFTKRDSNGNLIALYLQDEISGFAVHLLKTL